MTRPIKFRAWDKEKKEMRVGFFIGSIYGEVYCAEEIADRGKPLDPNNFVLLQFTGLLDKNGKEIYEGDVIEAPGIAVNKVQGVVEYQTNNCNFTYAALRGAEAIGNIYEQPELLK